VHAMKAYEESRGTSPHILNVLGGECLALLLDTFLQGKYPLSRGMGGPV
jgi:hypothetical protein